MSDLDRAISYLLDPMPLSTFFETYWEKEPLHLRRRSPTTTPASSGSRRSSSTSSPSGRVATSSGWWLEESPTSPFTSTRRPPSRWCTRRSETATRST